MGTDNTGSCNDLRAVCLAADAILSQCADYIDRVDDDQFVQESKVVPGGTIGKHIRHTLDHFRCAITTDCAEPIDYDHRKRGGSVEADRDAAKTEIATLRSLMGALGVENLNETVTTRVMLCRGAHLVQRLDFREAPSAANLRKGTLPQERTSPSTGATLGPKSRNCAELCDDQQVGRGSFPKQNKADPRVGFV